MSAAAAAAVKAAILALTDENTRKKIGWVLAAILSGMEHGLDAQVEPIASLNEDRSSGIDFPRDMLGAVAEMEDHPVVKDGLGSEFVFVYCENKRHDHLDFMNEVSAREYRWFL